MKIVISLYLYKTKCHIREFPNYSQQLFGVKPKFSETNQLRFGSRSPIFTEYFCLCCTQWVTTIANRCWQILATLVDLVPSPPSTSCLEWYFDILHTVSYFRLKCLLTLYCSHACKHKLVFSKGLTFSTILQQLLWQTPTSLSALHGTQGHKKT